MRYLHGIFFNSQLFVGKPYANFHCLNDVFSHAFIDRWLPFPWLDHTVHIRGRVSKQFFSLLHRSNLVTLKGQIHLLQVNIFPNESGI